MARSSLEKDSLTAKLKDIESLMTDKMAKKLTLEDLEALSSFGDKIQDLLVNKLGKIIPNAVKSNSYKTSSYKNNSNITYGSTPSNNPIGIASLNEPIVISANLGTGFSSGGISLFDVTSEVVNDVVNTSVKQTLQTENPGVEIKELPVQDELGRLNDIFASVEDVQQ